MLSEEPAAEPVEEETQPETTETETAVETTTEEPAEESKPKHTGTAQIFCGNISYSSTEEAISEYFSKYGEIANLLLAKKKQAEGAGHRGFAFISYKDNDVAQKVLNMNGHVLDGRDLTIKEAKPKTKKFFVGGLDRDRTDAKSLRAFFEQFGEIEDCFCPANKKFGFVTMVQNGDNIERILEQGKFDIDGCSVDVKPAQPKKEDRGRDGYGPPMHGGYGGGYGRPPMGGHGGWGGYGHAYSPYGGGRGGGRGGGYGGYGRY